MNEQSTRAVDTTALILELKDRLEKVEAEVAMLRGDDLLGPKNERNKPRRRMQENMPLTDEFLKVGTDAGYHEDRIHEIFAEFRRYWVDQGTARASWLATWRNRIKMEVARNPPVSSSSDMFGDLRGRYS